MIAKDVVRQFMTERVSNDFVIAVPVVCVGPQSQLYDLASIPVETQGARLVGRMVGRIHLRQKADAEFVFAHARLDAGIVAQPLEKFPGTRGAREVAEGKDGLECVGCFLLGFLPIAVARRGHGLDGRVGGSRTRARACEGGEFGGRGRKEDYLL